MKKDIETFYVSMIINSLEYIKESESKNSIDVENEKLLFAFDILKNNKCNLGSFISSAYGENQPLLYKIMSEYDEEIILKFLKFLTPDILKKLETNAYFSDLFGYLNHNISDYSNIYKAMIKNGLDLYDLFHNQEGGVALNILDNCNYSFVKTFFIDYNILDIHKPIGSYNNVLEVYKKGVSTNNHFGKIIEMLEREFNYQDLKNIDIINKTNSKIKI